MIYSMSNKINLYSHYNTALIYKQSGYSAHLNGIYYTEIVEDDLAAFVIKTRPPLILVEENDDHQRKLLMRKVSEWKTVAISDVHS